ncbi:MAG TPA: YggS family pyridoxal phosphate-dependent enzyme [bacterium]|nr:YggS family pyridoxal phosphate-dependent enzyme [bacterium]
MELKNITPEKFQQNYFRTIDSIKEQCLKNNRRFDELTIIIVSKYITSSSLKELISTNLIKDIGENRAQLLRERYETINNAVNWHFIGTLQSNKIKYFVEYIKLIHSITSEKLLSEINKQALKKNKIVDGLIEINTSEESSKTGAEKEAVFRLFDFYCNEKIKNNLTNLNIQGLMTMAALNADELKCRKSFSFLRKTLEQINNKFGINMKVLSMGMSADYLYAIAEGATHLRIGSIFFE